MGLNPQSSEDSTAVDRLDVFVGTVVSVPTETGPTGSQHTISVSPEHSDSEVPAIVTESTHGDAHLPTVGTSVLCLVAMTGSVYVIQRTYRTEDSVATTVPGERRLSHPLSDSHITFHEDGTLTVNGDSGTTVTIESNGDVVINGGSTAPITDIQTTTDGDGDITSIDVTRADGVFVPSK